MAIMEFSRHDLLGAAGKASQGDYVACASGTTLDVEMLITVLVLRRSFAKACHSVLEPMDTEGD